MTDHSLTRDGVAVHYEVYGKATDATPLLLTHGFSASTAMWRPNIETLAAGRQVIAWDIRGHGRTVAPPDQELFTHDASVADMAAILDACDVERAAVGGLSLGGFLSLAFYAAHPERVDALLLFDTGPGFNRDAGRERWNRFAESQAAAFEREGLGALGRSPEVSSGAHDPTGLALAARGILAQRDAAVIQSLPNIKVPTLVLVGANDDGFLNAADYMASAVPGARKCVIPDAGHAANIDQPETFNQAVNEFLSGL